MALSFNFPYTWPRSGIACPGLPFPCICAEAPIQISTIVVRNGKCFMGFFYGCEPIVGQIKNSKNETKPEF